MNATSNIPKPTKDDGNAGDSIPRAQNEETIIEGLDMHKSIVLVLVNPHSGRGRSVTIYKRTVAPFLAANNVGHNVFITKSESRVHNFIVTRELKELQSYKAIVVVAGDGLFHETLNALMARPDWQEAIKIPLAVVPTGSGNGLAYSLIKHKNRDIKHSEDAIKLCCEQLIGDETCMSDLVRVDYGLDKTIWSFLSIGWGLLSDIDIDSEWLRCLGELRFTIYGLLRAITSRSYKGRLAYKPAFDGMQDLESSSKFRTFLENESNATHRMFDEGANEPDHKYPVAGDASPAPSHADNTTFTTQASDEYDDWVHIQDRFACLYGVYQTYISSASNFAPKSKLADQLIYLTYIRGTLSPCQVIEFLLAIKDGSHERLPYVRVVPVRSFKFQPLANSKIVIDGELINWKLADGPLSAEVVSKVMTLAFDHNQ